MQETGYDVLQSVARILDGIENERRLRERLSVFLVEQLGTDWNQCQVEQRSDDGSIWYMAARGQCIHMIELLPDGRLVLAGKEE